MAFDWKALVKTVAPGIASVFGTPLAGIGVTARLNALLPEGETPPAQPEEYLAKVITSANPDVLLKIKAAEQQFMLDVKRLEIDLEKYLEGLESTNVENARNLKRDWLKSGKFDYEPLLAFGVCVSFGYAEWWVFANAQLSGLDPGHAVLIGRVLGTVDAAFMLLLSFRWGTSHDSGRKTDIIANGNGHKV
jgi:hypothetical protein